MSEPARARAPLAGGGSGQPPVDMGGGRRRKLPKVLSRGEMADLFRAPIGPFAARDKALIRFMYASACRVSEACGLTWDGIDWGREVARFWRPKVSSEHEVPLTPDSLEALRRLRSGISPAGPVFLSRTGGPLTPNGAWRMIRKWARCCGIPDAKCHSHILRASRATHLIENGCPLLAVQSHLGHVSARTTSLYLWTAKGWADEAIRAASR